MRELVGDLGLNVAKGFIRRSESPAGAPVAKDWTEDLEGCEGYVCIRQGE